MQKHFLFTTLLYLTTSLTSASVVIYPVPPTIPASPHYTVDVIQNGQTHTPFIYVTEAQLPRFNRSKSTSFTLFAFTGNIIIRVTKKEGNFKTAKVLPSSYQVKTAITGNTVQFVLDAPRKVALELDGDITHPLLIFADAPEEHVPAQNDPDVIYFGPGVHDLNEPITPRSGQTVYLAPGAFVKGLIKGDQVSNVTVKGRGILSGRKYGHLPNGKHIHFTGNDSRNITIEGITLLDAPGYNITTSAEATKISNVKCIGWWFNTDGIATGKNSLVEDCFLKCNDDAIKLYYSGMQVYRTTIWQMENGAPFMMSWNMNSDNENFVVKDCDVIHSDHQWDNPNEAVFTAIHGGSGHMQNYLFEDIRVENASWRLVSLQIQPNRFAKAEKLGKLSNITFKKILVTVPPNQPMKRLNLIQGSDKKSTIGNVTFDDLTINGNKVENADEGQFEINAATTSGVRFTASNTDGILKKPAGKTDDFFTWENPIRDGLHSYGQKDFHLIRDDKTWYLVATEMTNPAHQKRGLVLYASDDLLHWREEKYLFNRKDIHENAWYRDEWASPEIQKIKGKYYLTFNNRNNLLRPYKQHGAGLAVSDKITGPYKIVTEEKPLTEGAHFSLFEDTDGKVYAFWDRDGRFYAAEMDLEKAAFKTTPFEMLGPATMENFRYLDAPFLLKKDGVYHLISTSFYAGYIIRVRTLTSHSPLGPWKLTPGEPLMTFIEAEADEVQKMPYAPGYTFPPPTQVIFSHQLFKGPGDKLYIAYHSSEKYSEPYLVIEPVEFKNGKLTIINHKFKRQQVKLK